MEFGKEAVVDFSTCTQFDCLAKKHMDQDMKELSLKNHHVNSTSYSHLSEEGQIFFQFIVDNNVTELRKLVNISSEEEKVQIMNYKDRHSNNGLHVAALYKRFDILDVLCNELEMDPNERNYNNDTPFHIIVRHQYCWDSSVHLQNIKTLEIILSSRLAGNVVNAQNKTGCTVLHIATRKHCMNCVRKLIEHGAKFNLKSKKDAFVIPSLCYELPEFASEFERQMDTGMSYAEDDGKSKHLSTVTLSESEAELLQLRTPDRVFDFRSILPASNSIDYDNCCQKEMELLECIFAKVPKQQRGRILNHPLVQVFLYLKWRRVRVVYMISLICHILLAALYTLYVFNIFVKNCPYQASKNATKSNSIRSMVNLLFSFQVFQSKSELGSNSTNFTLARKNCDSDIGSFGTSLSLLILTLILTLHEILILCHDWKTYVKTIRKYLVIAMIVCIFLTTWPIYWTKDKKLSRWQYAASAYGVCYIWASQLLLAGRFSKVGIYVEMFGRVLKNLGLFVLAYSFVLFGFAFSFCILFPDYAPFETLPRSLLNVLIMMSGEVNSEFFYGSSSTSADDSLFHPVTAHLIYGSFVIIVTIAMMNLLIGMAVQDINVLQQNANLSKICRQIFDVAYLESFLYSSSFPTWKWLTRFINYLKRKFAYVQPKNKDKKFQYIFKNNLLKENRCFPEQSLHDFDIRLGMYRAENNKRYSSCNEINILVPHCVTCRCRKISLIHS